jgi:hypothetical protein
MRTKSFAGRKTSSYVVLALVINPAKTASFVWERRP